MVLSLRLGKGAFVGFIVIEGEISSAISSRARWSNDDAVVIVTVVSLRTEIDDVGVVVPNNCSKHECV